MTTRGIFILENVRSRQREGEWVPLDNVWVNPGSGTPVQWKSGGEANLNKGFCQTGCLFVRLFVGTSGNHVNTCLFFVFFTSR